MCKQEPIYVIHQNAVCELRYYEIKDTPLENCDALRVESDVGVFEQYWTDKLDALERLEDYLLQCLQRCRQEKKPLRQERDQHYEDSICAELSLEPQNLMEADTEYEEELTWQPL